jgi:hypothetical protein
LSDAILNTASGRPMPVRLHSGGVFSVNSADILPEGLLIAESVLSDRQQRRQEMYRQILKRAETAPQGDGNVLLAWAEPIDMPFTLAPDARTVGNALLMLPLRLERPARGERVTIPAPLIRARRMLDSGPVKLPPESERPVEMDIRFQLPREALPFRVERAKFTARISAPFRRITVTGMGEPARVELHHVDSPLDPVRVEITDERCLSLDGDGGLHVNFAVSAPLSGSSAGKTSAGPNEKWILGDVELEVVGRAE